MDLDPVITTGIHTVIVAIMAMLYGSVLEKFFADKPDTWVIAQFMLIGMGYDFIREHYKPDPDAWVVFSAAVFAAQPTLLPRFKRLLKLN